MLGKNSSEKSAKNVFFIFTRISWPKNGGENSRNNFSRNTRIVPAKNVGEKIVGKKWEKCFFILTRISWTKNGGEKNSRNNFSRNTGIVLEKNLRKNVRKTFFYIHTNIVTKKWGEQNAQNNFSRYTRIVRAKNVGEKIDGKNCEKLFFIFTRLSWPKYGVEKTRETMFSETHE